MTLERRTRLALVSLSSALLLWSYFLYSVSSLRSAGYTLSLYSLLGLGPWLGFFAGIFLAILSFWFSALAANRSRSLIGLSLMLVFGFTTLVALLPEFAGYSVFARGDVIAHATTTASIVKSGHIPVSDFYPSVHLLAGMSTFVLGSSIEGAFTLLPIVMILVFAGSLYIIVRRLTNSNLVPLTAFLLGVLPIRGGYEVALHPSSLSLSLVPLFLWIYMESIRAPSFSRSLLLSLTVVGLIVIHPLTTAFLLGGFALLFVLAVVRRFTKWSLLDNAGSFSRPLITVLIGVATTSWLMGFTVWASNVRILGTWLRGELQTPLESIAGTAVRGGLSTEDLVSYGVRLFAPTIILLAIASSWLLLPSKNQSAKAPAKRNCIVFVSLGLFLALTWIVTLVGPLGLDPFRSINYLTVPIIAVASVPMGGVLIDRRRARVVALSACVGLLVVSGVFTMYTSPYVLQPNYQVTPAELSASAWFVEGGVERQALVNVWPFNGQVDLAAALLNHNYSGYAFISSPDHLGYNQSITSLAELYPPGTAIVVTSFDILTTTSLWQSTQRFALSDFARLETDPGLVKAYANPDVTIWITERIY